MDFWYDLSELVQRGGCPAGTSRRWVTHVFMVGLSQHGADACRSSGPAAARSSLGKQLDWKRSFLKRAPWAGEVI
jgi:hypothetical protein